jgi:glycosyltransferase involved in cell wall biosynthesis
MSIDFTVAIPTYNGKMKLPTVLEKLQCQIGSESLNWEIIIVDNNSNDGTASLVKKYQDNWQYKFKLRYIFEAKQGLSFARDRGVAEANSPLVGFLDDDNLPLESWVIEAYKFAQKYPQAGAIASQIHGLFEVEPSDNLKQIIFYLAINERGSKPVLYEPSKKGVPPGAGLVVRKQVWLDSVPNNLFLIGRVGKSMLAGEDAEALLYIHRAGWEIWYNPTMEIQHLIPSWRLEKNYLIPMMRGIGLSRYHLRMLLVQTWQRPFFFFLYLLSDFRKLIVYLILNGTSIKSDITVACEVEKFFSTLISPFYLWQLKVSRFLGKY